MNIIIFGTGKAGILHFNKYKKIKTVNKVFFIDPYANFQLEYPVYKTLDNLLYNEKIDCEHVIVDICTPHSEFKKIIKQCMKRNLYNIIVEKPFIVSNKYFLDKEKLNIIMVHNYLFSKIVTDAKEIIEKNKYTIESIYTNFSKNRIADSSKLRGINNKITTAFEVEMPHQIYIANSFLLKNTIKKINEIYTKDMKINDMILNNHGYGYISVNNDKVLIVHESNLMNKDTVKQILLNFNDNYSILISFILYDKNFNIIENGKLTITKNNELIEEYNYEEDDNIFAFLKYAYNSFSSKKSNIFIEQKKFIIDFSKEMSLYLKSIEK